MSRPRKKKTKTDVQLALIDLRRHLQMTQLQLANALGLTPVTVARWETTQPPRGSALQRLVEFADSRGAIVWANIFSSAQRQQDEMEDQRGSPKTDEDMDLETALGNVYRMTKTIQNPRLDAYWIRILEALVPAHRLVMKRAVQDKNAAQFRLLHELSHHQIYPGKEDLALAANSIESLRDLNHRLADYLKQALEKRQTVEKPSEQMKRGKRNPSQ
jgi:transcriptional regulator with XRE-family HTH domain